MALVPQINSYGEYVLITPFVIDPRNYRCSSIQLLSALDSNDVDIFNQIYAPKGLDTDIYTRDVSDNVSIITLVSDVDTITVPSSYIGAIPPELSVPYSNNIISLQIGQLPDSVSLTNLMDQLEDVVQTETGNRPAVRLHRIASKNSISVTESAILEADRELRKGNVVNFYSSSLIVQAENAVLRDRIAALEIIVINLTPP